MENFTLKMKKYPASVYWEFYNKNP